MFRIITFAPDLWGALILSKTEFPAYSATLRVVGGPLGSMWRDFRLDWQGKLLSGCEHGPPTPYSKRVDIFREKFRTLQPAAKNTAKPNSVEAVRELILHRLL